MLVIYGAALMGFAVIVYLTYFNHYRTGPAHEWSEEFEIGGQEYSSKYITLHVQKRRLRICNVCMITDALTALHPFCKGPQSHGER